MFFGRDKMPQGTKESAPRDGRMSLLELARTAGVHPVYLSQAFRNARGCTLRQTVQRLRVRRACRLFDQGATLSEAAQATGFVDQSHLTAAFRKVTGRTPGAVRRLLRDAAGDDRSWSGPEGATICRSSRGGQTP